MNAWQLLRQGDALTQGVALLLLAMSVASWVVILWKGWMLRRAGADLVPAIAAFWAAPSLTEAQSRIAPHDREALLAPLLAAAQVRAVGTLAASGDRATQLTRVLRDALHRVLDKLQFGQVLLATVGATSPFVGLLGTVWGIYGALAGIGATGQISIDKVAGPVGEALVMTAAGLAVAIPAVVAYNIYGRLVGRIEAELEGFARDLRELLSHDTMFVAAAPSAAGPSQGAGAPPEGSEVHDLTGVGAQ